MKDDLSRLESELRSHLRSPRPELRGRVLADVRAEVLRERWMRRGLIGIAVASLAAASLVLSVRPAPIAEVSLPVDHQMAQLSAEDAALLGLDAGEWRRQTLLAFGRAQLPRIAPPISSR